VGGFSGRDKDMLAELQTLANKAEHGKNGLMM